MISGVHALLYSTDAAADRAFLRDVLGWRFVEDHPGWLIFALPPAEVGVHPLGPDEQPRHELFLMCDDVHATVRELGDKGARFDGDVTEAGFGLLVTLLLPSGARIGLYEPRHQVATDISS
jgi:catechol 2,3-dioxygenase-like lactoylglutathione lyase family enzyme